MSNKKVYLAKSTLASGFDVEYVKSNLLRIPGIELVEFNSGIHPKECMSMVIVGAPKLGSFYYEGEKTEDDNLIDSVELESNIAKLVKKFCKQNEEYPEEALERVYVYTEETHRAYSADCESTMPLCAYLVDIEDTEEDSTFFEASSSFNLLDMISLDCNINSNDWHAVPRRFTPREEFRIPEAPSIEERTIKAYARSSSIISEKLQTVVTRRRLLKLRK